MKLKNFALTTTLLTVTGALIAGSAAPSTSSNSMGMMGQIPQAIMPTKDDVSQATMVIKQLSDGLKVDPKTNETSLILPKDLTNFVRETLMFAQQKAQMADSSDSQKDQQMEQIQMAYYSIFGPSDGRTALMKLMGDDKEFVKNLATYDADAMVLHSLYNNMSNSGTIAYTPSGFTFTRATLTPEEQKDQAAKIQSQQKKVMAELSYLQGQFKKKFSAEFASMDKAQQEIEVHQEEIMRWVLAFAVSLNPKMGMLTPDKHEQVKEAVKTVLLSPGVSDNRRQAQRAIPLPVVKAIQQTTMNTATTKK